MPMIWNAEADAKLMATVLQVCDVKVTGEHYDIIAKAMGCTPKALKHRMQKIRQAGKEGGGSDDTNNEEAGDDAVKTKPAAKATKTTAPKKKAAAGAGKKKAAVRTPSPGAADDDEEQTQLTPPPSTRPKRDGAKRDYAALAGGNAESESEHEEEEAAADGLSTKKVKIEVGEDIGEGLREEGGVEDEDAEMDGAGFFTRVGHSGLEACERESELGGGLFCGAELACGQLSGC